MARRDGDLVTSWDPPGIPFYVAVDQKRNRVYVTTPVGDVVQKFKAGGAFLTDRGGPASGDGQFNDPLGMAVDHTRKRIYVADRGNNRIQVLTG